ncbi:MAG TPA: hypothetical protein VM221_02995 [Armatimonadota bacterium]|nr:hypothetical protein [Armatimonadota bacterium]
MAELLKHYALSHGGVRPVLHPRLGVRINGQTCVRYLRFLRPVRVERLELGLVPGGGSGRIEPNVPTHPAHIIISVLAEDGRRWRTVKEVDLPANAVIAGGGLSQDMSAEHMSTLLEQARREVLHVIPLDRLRTDHLRVECDREHPVWPSHGEMNGGPFNVPFCILSPLQAFGDRRSDTQRWPQPPPLLAVERCGPEAPAGMTVEDRPDMLLYESDRLSVGFSLRRPMLMHLGWDAFGRGQAGDNRLARRIMVDLAQSRDSVGQPLPVPVGLSGPVLRTLSTDCGAHLWTGEVAVEGNRVSYRNLRCEVEGPTVDATFTVESDRLYIEVAQHCRQDLPALEFEAWRFAWDLGAAITGAAAMPTLLPGRNGDVCLPMHWAGDGPGSLSCRVLEGMEHSPHLQVESYRCRNVLTGGLWMGERCSLDAPMVIPAGTRRALVEFAVTALAPAQCTEGPEPWPGIASHWSVPFACFRPELGGFSDHSASVNCHTNQADVIEAICFTRPPEHGPSPLDLVRFTIGRALLDGGGYGYFRNLFMDADPQIMISTGRVHQVAPDLQWLRGVEAGLAETVARMLDAMDAEGLARCRDLSGNTGSHRWSTNSMDVVGFGHQDAYVNALSYRGFRNAAALLAELGRRELADRCREASASILGAYATAFLNPETGWVAGWRSRDGQLHDYAFLDINGMAAAFGLLEREAACAALLNLEKLRREKRIGSARLGLPLNLLPIRPGDHMLGRWFGELTPTFENYTDGSLYGNALYYLRALSCCGLKEHARRLARELDEAYAYGVFDGGNYTGAEFHSWEGMANGYEGTMASVFGSLYAIAVEQGILTPPDPEWWPAGG